MNSRKPIFQSPRHRRSERGVVTILIALGVSLLLFAGVGLINSTQYAVWHDAQRRQVAHTGSEHNLGTMSAAEEGLIQSGQLYYVAWPDRLLWQWGGPAGNNVTKTFDVEPNPSSFPAGKITTGCATGTGAGSYDCPSISFCILNPDSYSGTDFATNLFISATNSTPGLTSIPATILSSASATGNCQPFPPNDSTTAGNALNSFMQFGPVPNQGIWNPNGPGNYVPAFLYSRVQPMPGPNNPNPPAEGVYSETQVSLDVPPGKLAPAHPGCTIDLPGNPTDVPYGQAILVHFTTSYNVWTVSSGNYPQPTSGQFASPPLPTTANYPAIAIQTIGGPGGTSYFVSDYVTVINGTPYKLPSGGSLTAMPYTPPAAPPNATTVYVQYSGQEQYAWVIPAGYTTDDSSPTKTVTLRLTVYGPGGAGTCDSTTITLHPWPLCNIAAQPDALIQGAGPGTTTLSMVDNSVAGGINSTWTERIEDCTANTGSCSALLNPYASPPVSSPEPSPPTGCSAMSTTSSAPSTTATASPTGLWLYNSSGSPSPACPTCFTSSVTCQNYQGYVVGYGYTNGVCPATNSGAAGVTVASGSQCPLSNYTCPVDVPVYPLPQCQLSATNPGGSSLPVNGATTHQQITTTQPILITLLTNDNTNTAFTAINQVSPIYEAWIDYTGWNSVSTSIVENGSGTIHSATSPFTSTWSDWTAPIHHDTAADGYGWSASAMTSTAGAPKWNLVQQAPQWDFTYGSYTPPYPGNFPNPTYTWTNTWTVVPKYSGGAPTIDNYFAWVQGVNGVTNSCQLPIDVWDFPACAVSEPVDEITQGQTIPVTLITNIPASGLSGPNGGPNPNQTSDLFENGTNVAPFGPAGGTFTPPAPPVGVTTFSGDVVGINNYPPSTCSNWLAVYTQPTCSFTMSTASAYPGQPITYTFTNNYVSGAGNPPVNESSGNPIVSAILNTPSGSVALGPDCSAGCTVTVPAPDPGPAPSGGYPVSYTVTGSVTGVNNPPAVGCTTTLTLTVNEVCPYLNPYMDGRPGDGPAQTVATSFGTACVGPYVLQGGAGVPPPMLTVSDPYNPFGTSSQTTCPPNSPEIAGEMFLGTGMPAAYAYATFDSSGNSPACSTFPCPVNCLSDSSGNPTPCFQGRLDPNPQEEVCTTDPAQIIQLESSYHDNCLLYSDLSLGNPPTTTITVLGVTVCCNSGIIPTCPGQDAAGNYYYWDGTVCCPAGPNLSDIGSPLFHCGPAGHENFLVRINGGINNAACWPQVIGERRIGCFSPETSIRLASGGTVRADEVRQGTWLWNPVEHRPVRVGKVVAGPEKLGLIELGYDELRLDVTTTHPIPTDKGLRKAIDLKPGDRVLGVDGKYHPLAIARQLPPKADQRVWNFETDEESTVPEDHMIEADGMVTGDLSLQNRLEKGELP